ncbi:MAG: hypothetical protein OHK0039_19590 [Bacteroidia bacterium]
MHRYLHASLIAVLLLLGSLTQAQAQGAAFSASDTTGCAPITITFTDLSVGGPVAWLWNFGDGTTSTQQNPSHTYTAANWYQVSLTITYAGGTTSQAWMLLDLAGPNIWWAGPNAQICGPGPVSLFAAYDSSQNNVFAWDITGPVNATSSDEFPTVNLSLPGTYTVVLTMTDTDGCTDSYTTTLVVPAGIQTTVTTQDASCSANNGSATAVASGGVPPYFYQWSNGSSNSTISGLAPGLYAVTVYDTLGCSDTDTVQIGQTGLNVSGTVTSGTCDNAQDGAISVSVSGGSGSYTFSWNNGATTQNLSNLTSGTYIVTVSDGTCTGTDTFYVDASTLSLAFASTDAACDGTGGGASVSVSGGTAPYSYLWSNGATTSSIAGVNAGGYSVTVTDATGCDDHVVGFVTLLDTCQITISGQVYYDLNANCAFDGQDVAIQGWVTLSNGQSVLADTNGHYAFDVVPGSYVLGINTGYFNYLSLVCPSTGLYVLNNLQSDTPGMDFALVGDSTARDLRVHVYQSTPRPGFAHYYSVWVSNDGGLPIAPVVRLYHDPLASLASTTPPATTYDPATQTATWILPMLLPGQSAYLSGTGALPATVPLGTLLTTMATAEPVFNDLTPANNADTLQRQVVGSYDPNDKQVQPAGEGSAGYIGDDQQQLRYTIRFQNTGTDTAFFVVIRDTIDQDLNPLTFKPATASHPSNFSMEEERIFIFSFPNILLPDSTTDLAGSQGHVSFTIYTQGTLAPGTEIRNTAAIYFDFNAPVITNTTLNTIADEATGLEPAWAENLHLGPNPTADRCVIQFERGMIDRAQAFDMAGRPVGQWVASDPHRLDLSLRSLAGGVYMLRIQTDQGTISRRLIVSK